MEWDHLISGPDAIEQLKIPGTLQLMSGQDDAVQSDTGWTEAHLLLRILAVMGLRRLPDICDGNTIVLPTTISGAPSSACRRVLDRVAESRGSSIRGSPYQKCFCCNPANRREMEPHTYHTLAYKCLAAWLFFPHFF